MMSAFCGNSECPSNWADLPCTCPPETPLVELPVVAIGVDGDTTVVAVRGEAGPELFIPLDNTDAKYVPTKPLTPWHFDLPDSAVDRLLAEVLATPEGPELTPEQSLLVELTVLVTEAQHPVGVCYITPDDTVCHCLIGRVKAVLPRCTATKLGPRTEEHDFGEYWRCVMIEHPDNPGHHHFEKA